MKFPNMKKVLSFLLCIVLIAAMALSTTGCNEKASNNNDNSVVTLKDGQSLGKGATKFTFVVGDKDGKEITVEISTDKKTVGDALVELNLIAGEKGEYGLMVNTVNGVTLDWNKDQMYWAFFINGEYASTGVDSTEITAGATYKFVPQKG